MCYADKRCMTAVYRKNGDCLFIRNFTDTLTIEDDSESYDITEEILQIKTKTANGKFGSQVNIIILDLFIMSCCLLQVKYWYSINQFNISALI